MLNFVAYYMKLNDFCQQFFRGFLKNSLEAKNWSAHFLATVEKVVFGVPIWAIFLTQMLSYYNYLNSKKNRPCSQPL
jgi:hypothetical protein